MANIKCGNCKGTHDSVAAVRECYGTERVNTVAAPSVQGPAWTAPATQHVEDGYYTVVFDDGDYRTIRVRTQPQNASFAAGEQIASFLSGPDNESDYTGFAFVKPDGRFFVWKRFKENTEITRALSVLVSDPETAGQEYALRSNNCRRCARTLTVPASINRGFGPTCAEIVGE